MSTDINPPSSPVARKGLKLLTTAAGILIVVLGFGSAIIYLISLFTAIDDFTRDNSIATAALAGLGVALGGALVWHSGRAFLGKPTTLFQPLAVGWLIPLYIAVVVLGQIVITFDFFPTLAFPLFHILAAALPPFGFIIFAGRTLIQAGLRWRDVVLQLASGAFLSTSLAFVAELVLGILLLITITVITALTPTGRHYLIDLMDNLQNPVWLQNPENIQELLLLPPVSVTIGLVFIVIAPLLEEAFKLVGVMMMSYRRPSKAQIFVWGLANGAGFALVENLFNTVLALEVWAFVMLLRLGGTAMHTLGTGLIALGWQQWLAERRLWRVLGMYGLSVIIHATWNGVVIGMAGISVLAAGSSNDIVLGLIGAGVIALLLGLLVMTLALLVTMVIITRRLKRELTPE